MSDQDLRAADADRERAAQRLRRAHDEGRVGLLEFDERVAAAYGARTYADLAPLTADLPPDPWRERPGSSSPAESPRAPRSDRSAAVAPGAGRGRRGWALSRRIELAAWAAAGLVNVVVWALVSVAAGGGVYPWWVWVVGPWGVALLAQYVVARVLPPGSPPRMCR
jgi:hypothetical protein